MCFRFRLLRKQPWNPSIFYVILFFGKQQYFFFGWNFFIYIFFKDTKNNIDFTQKKFHGIKKKNKNIVKTCKNLKQKILLKEKREHVKT